MLCRIQSGWTKGLSDRMYAAEPTAGSLGGEPIELADCPELFQIRGHLQTLLALKLIRPRDERFFLVLQQALARSPKFFRHAPVVLDAGAVAGQPPLNLAEFARRLRQQHLVPVGLQNGDEAWSQLLEWHDKTLRSLFLAHGGEEIKHVGDGFFVAFEDPAGAIDCAVAVQRTLAEHRRAHGFAPKVRIGVHCGDATRKGGDYEGGQVHVAARVAGLAGGDEILISKTACTESKRDFSDAETRTVSLKGVAEPVEVTSLDWR